MSRSMRANLTAAVALAGGVYLMRLGRHLWKEPAWHSSQ